MEYYILSCRSKYDLTDAVKRYMSRGWKPLGGVSVSITSFHEVWAQTMIKES